MSVSSFRDPEPGDLFRIAGRLDDFYLTIAELTMTLREGERAVGWLVKAKEDGALWKLQRKDDSMDGVRFKGWPVESGPSKGAARADGE